MLKFLQGLAPGDRVRDERLRAAFAAAPVGLALAGPDDRFLVSNDIASQLLGHSREELCRVSLLDITHPDDQQRARADARKLASGEVSLYQIHRRVADRLGKYREIFVSAALAGGKHDRDATVYVIDVPRRNDENGAAAEPAAKNDALVAELREELQREREGAATLTRVLEKQKARRVELEQELGALQKRVVRSETSEAAAAVWTPFEERNALDLVEQIAREGKTGLLLFVSEGRQKSIHLEGGRIASCASNDDEQSLGERLVREGVITEAQRDEALEMAGETNIALGRALVLLDTLAEEVVVVALRAKLGKELADLESWVSGRWTFVEREPPRDRPVRLSIPIQDARDPC